MTFEYFAVANRKVSGILNAMSVASAWIWAPALFLSAQIAYTWGIVGLLMFLVPNVLAIVLFAYAADIIAKRHPSGITLTDVIESYAGPWLQRMYKVELFVLAVCAIAVQLIAGSTLLSAVFAGVNVQMCMLLLITVPALYTALYGIRASVVADAMFYMTMIAVLIGIVGTIAVSGTVAQIKFTGTVDISLYALILGFGIPTAIGLLSGIFGSQDFYQRMFATDKAHVKNVFIGASVLFAVVPIMMSVLGFVGAGAGIGVPNTLLTNFTVLSTVGSPMLVYGLVCVVIAGLVSTIDSSQMSAGTLWARYTKKDSTAVTRYGIVIASLLGFMIASTGVTVLQLFLVYGAMRSSVFGITLVLIYTGRKLSTNSVAYTLMFVWVTLLPVNVLAILYKVVELQSVMAVLIVLIPGIAAYIETRRIDG